MPRDDMIEIAAELRHSTDGAHLLFDGAKEVWVPKSLCWESEPGIWMVKEWKAEELGLI